MEFVATCAKGLEAWLADELRALSCPRVRPLTGQVSWSGELSGALSACLWSRTASRVVAVLARGKADAADDLYELVRSVSWSDHIPAGASISVDARGVNDALRSTRFVAQRTKDAVTDTLLARGGIRPRIDLRHPDLRIVIRLTQRGAVVGLDLAGEPLFRRGYGVPAGGHGRPQAPRADIAAGLLHAAGWPRRHSREGASLLALYPGAGTVLAEAVGMATGHAPGLLRGSWGHTRWLGGNARAWAELVDEAWERANREPGGATEYVACDMRGDSEAAARALLRGAGLRAPVTFMGPRELADLDGSRTWTVACDLSWLDEGDVALQAAALGALATAMDATTRAHGRGDEDAPATTQPTACPHVDGRAGRVDTPHAPWGTHARNTAFPDAGRASGSLALLARDELADVVVGTPASVTTTMLGRDGATFRSYAHAAPHEPQAVRIAGASVPVLVSTSDQFAARLARVARLRARWARGNDVSCYRIYDADLPDYNLSIDLFEGSATPGRWLQVSEYAPPAHVDATRARARLLDAVAIASHTLRVRPSDVHVRVRRRERGGSQYADEARPHAGQGPSRAHGTGAAGAGAPLPGGAHLVDEGGLTFEVNFRARHDCGLFLDHRETRAWLRELAKDRRPHGRFLNLFCYTGSATCYAADGGCQDTTSVDLSAPSLAWAQRNMARNGFAAGSHRFVQADVLRWVDVERHGHNRYDLVFCDVPTFSNSSRMGRRSFEVQRDHVELLIGVSRLLARSHGSRDAGVCIFSCNLRHFQLDVRALERAGVDVEDVTARTIPADFSRTPGVHHAFLLRRMPR